MSGTSKTGSKNRKKNEKKKEAKMKENVANSKKQTSIYEAKDPVLILKAKLREAKANNDLTLSAKLRQDLWILQDVNAGHDPALEDKQAIEESLTRLASDSLLKTSKHEETVTETSHSTESSQPSVSGESKEIKKLKKKLDDIDKLKVRKEKGETLEKSQLEKLEREESIREELRDWEKAMSGNVNLETINTNKNNIEVSVDMDENLEKSEKENSICKKIETIDTNETTKKISHTVESPQKEIKKLRKKIEQITKLKSKRDNGETLDTPELEKIEKEESIREEIEQLENMSFDVVSENDNTNPFITEVSADKFEVDHKNDSALEKSQLEKLEKENNISEELPLEKTLSTNVSTSETVDLSKNNNTSETVDINKNTTETSLTTESSEESLSMKSSDGTLESVNTNEKNMEASVGKHDVEKENGETLKISKSEKEDNTCEKLPSETNGTTDISLEINETTTKESLTTYSSQQCLSIQREIKKLKKKIDQINKLKLKQDKGEELNIDELEKIEKEESILGQILQLEIDAVHLAT